MSFSKSFPRTTEKSSYPLWEEISLNDEEEKQIEKLAHNENIVIMKKCFQDAKKIISEENLKDYQSDIVKITISLFEKRASHSVYWKEAKCKEKFDEKFKNF